MLEYEKFMPIRNQYSWLSLLLIALILCQACTSSEDKSDNDISVDQSIASAEAGDTIAEEVNLIEVFIPNHAAALPGEEDTTHDSLVQGGGLYLQLKELLKIASGHHIVQVTRLFEDILLSTDLSTSDLSICNNSGNVSLDNFFDDLWSGYSALYSLENCSSDEYVLNGSIHKYHTKYRIGRSFGNISVTQDGQSTVTFMQPHEHQSGANNDIQFAPIIPTHGKPNLQGVFSRRANSFSISYPDGTLRIVTDFENYCNIHDGQGSEHEIEINQGDQVNHIGRMESRFTITDTLFGGATLHVEVMADDSKTGWLKAENESGSLLEAVFQAENEPAIMITLYQDDEIRSLNATESIDITLNCEFGTRFFKH